MNAYFKQIDAFRFFAAFAVLIAHWLSQYDWIERMMFGRIGVEFFFVISGFLISLQLHRLADFVQEKSLSKLKAYWTFFIRRALRIFPLYYSILFLVTIFNKGQLRDAFLWNLSYASNFYFIKIEKWTSSFSHFWSLSVEEHFYIFWPIVVLLIFRKQLPKFILLLGIAALAFRVIYSTHDLAYFYTFVHTISCIDLFMIGACLAYLYKYKHDKFERFFSSKTNRNLIFYTFILAVMLIAIFDEFQIFHMIFARSILGIYFGLILGCLVVGIPGSIGNFLENKWLSLGGKLSYAIYLIHNFVPGMLLGLKSYDLPTPLLFVIYFVVTILLSLLFHYVIEKPMRQLNRFFPMPYKSAQSLP